MKSLAVGRLSSKCELAGKLKTENEAE